MVNANLMVWQVGLIDSPCISNYLYIPYIQHSLRACVKNMITFYTRYKKSSFGSSSSFIADLRERPDMSILIVSGWREEHLSIIGIVITQKNKTQQEKSCLIVYILTSIIVFNATQNILEIF